MAKSLALNDTAIRKAKLKDKPYKMADGRGLFLLVQPKGGKLWRYKYSFEGKEKLLSIGPYPDVTLSAARERHQEARRLVESGIDPMAQRKAEVTAQKAATEGAFANVYALWLAHWRQNKSPRHAEYTERRIAADVLPILGARPIAEIDAMEIVAMAKRIEARGARDVAKRAIQTAGQVFEYGISHGYCQRNPARDIKVGNILAPAETRNMPRVELPELPELLRAIDKYKGLITRLAMKLLALTFVRPSNLSEAPWSEVDLDNARWVISKERMKRINGTPRTPHIVPLSRQAVEILRALQQLTGGSEFLFPGEQGNACMSNNTILSAMENMGYKKRMTGHGFRGIASTVLHEHQFPHEHIELQMAHMKRDKVSAAYDYAKHLEPRAKMMQWYADYLDRVRQGAKVISIDIAS